MTNREIELMRQENKMLWDLVGTKAKVCDELCKIIADLEEKLKHAHP